MLMVTKGLTQHSLHAIPIYRSRDPALGQRQAQPRAAAATGCEDDHETRADFLAAVREHGLELARLKQTRGSGKRRLRHD